MDHDTTVKWLERANSQTLDSLTDFIVELVHETLGDRIADIVPIVALAAMHATVPDESVPVATYFWYREGPKRILALENMLYPQFGYQFYKPEITHETWEWLQRNAARLLSEVHGSPAVRAHWFSIVNGNVPFGYTVAD